VNGDAELGAPTTINPEETITRMLGDLEALLEALTLQPQLRLSDLPKLIEKG
jgi:hypothetical protein